MVHLLAEKDYTEANIQKKFSHTVTVISQLEINIRQTWWKDQDYKAT